MFQLSNEIFKRYFKLHYLLRRMFGHVNFIGEYKIT